MKGQEVRHLPSVLQREEEFREGAGEDGSYKYPPAAVSLTPSIDELWKSHGLQTVNLSGVCGGLSHIHCITILLYNFSLFKEGLFEFSRVCKPLI